VNVVGGTTCGKPYGFIPKDNCGTTDYAIQFQGSNEQGFGANGDGIAPTCAVPMTSRTRLATKAKRGWPRPSA